MQRKNHTAMQRQNLNMQRQTLVIQMTAVTAFANVRPFNFYHMDRTMEIAKGLFECI